MTLTENMRWRVSYVKDGRIHRIDVGSDLAEALRLYGQALASDRTNVTLGTTNTAFPPPEKYRPRVVTFDKPRRRKGTNELVSTVRVVPMQKLNRAGIWWCPFCIKLRRFKFEKGWFTQEQVWMPEPRFVCPVCRIDHNNQAVRQWNPLAAQAFYSQDVRDPTAKPRRTRRRRKRTREEE